MAFGVILGAFAMWRVSVAMGQDLQVCLFIGPGSCSEYDNGPYIAAVAWTIVGYLAVLPIIAGVVDLLLSAFFRRRAAPLDRVAR